MTERIKVVAHIPVEGGGVVISEVTGELPSAPLNDGTHEDTLLRDIGLDGLGLALTVRNRIPSTKEGTVDYETVQTFAPDSVPNGYAVREMD